MKYYKFVKRVLFAVLLILTTSVILCACKGVGNDNDDVGKKSENSLNYKSIMDENLKTYKIFKKKAKKGEPIVIGYLGGSITVGAATYPLKGENAEGNSYNYVNYNANDDSWRAITYKWLKEKFEVSPGQFSQLNAAIGGTDSAFGAFRVHEHLLAEKAPDFLFLEFAVNDNGRGKATANDPYANDSIYNSILKIILQVKAANPDVAIFVPVSTYRLNSNAWKNVSENFQTAADATISAANMFKIPYIDIKSVFYDLELPVGIDRNHLYDGADDAGNGVHPSPLGHKAYGEGVIKALDKIFESLKFDFADEGEIDLNRLNPYPDKPSYITADHIPTEGIKGIIKEVSAVNLNTPVESSKTVLNIWSLDSELSFNFKGDLVGLNFIIEKCNGSADVYLDGVHLGVWNANAEGKSDFKAVRINIFAKNLDKKKVHELRFKPCAQQNLPKSKTFNIQIRGIIVNGELVN